MKRALMFLLVLNLLPAMSVGAQVVNVKLYGAKGDGRAVTHAVAKAGNATLADTLDSPWTASDIGKTIVIYSATFSPGLLTTIQSFTDPAHIVLAEAPASSATLNAVWGSDDTLAIQTAVAAIPKAGPNNDLSVLYFPAGIYLTGEAITFSNASGLRVRGDGAGSAASLGTYNTVHGQPGGGTSLVWIGPAGGVIGCSGKTGSPPAGLADATTNCTAAENYMMKLSGQFLLEDLNLQGSRRASHLLLVGGGDASNTFDFSIRNVFGGYATQYALVLGGTGAEQPANFGDGYLENSSFSYNGLVNSALPESDPTCGGDVFVRYNNGNFQVQWNTGFLGSSSDVDGCHHVYWYNGNYGTFNNLYFAPLTGNRTSHSSLYYAAPAGVSHTFDNLYDENGYFLHVAGGNHFDLRQVQVRKQTITNPHQAMVFDSNAAVNLNGVFTAGLPILFNAGGVLNHQQVDIGSIGIGSAGLYSAHNCAGGGCITRSGSTVTLTTASPHGFATGDWIQVSGVADATYNGVFQITSTGSTTFTYVDPAAAGGSTQGGTSAIGCCIIASTTTNLTPQAASPFINYNTLWNGYGSSNADIFSAIATNLAAKNTIVFIPARLSGANGSSLPATIPAGWNFLDLRGGTPTFFGGPFRWGSSRNPVQTAFNGSILDGTAMKHGRVSTGSCAPTGCSVTLTWATAFPDTDYTVSCGLEDATAQSETTGLRLGHITSKAAASLTLTIDNLSSSSVTGTLHCIALHD